MNAEGLGFAAEEAIENESVGWVVLVRSVKTYCNHRRKPMALSYRR